MQTYFCFLVLFFNSKQRKKISFEHTLPSLWIFFWIFFKIFRISINIFVTEKYLKESTEMMLLSLNRSSRPDVFCKKGVLSNFAKFTGKHLCQNFFFNKVAGWSAKTPFITEHLRWLLLFKYMFLSLLIKVTEIHESLTDVNYGLRSYIKFKWNQCLAQNDFK